MMHKALTILTLALLTVSSAQGEVSAKKKVIEAEVDTLQLIIQAGDSCMQQYNTVEALKFYQQADEILHSPNITKPRRRGR